LESEQSFRLLPSKKNSVTTMPGVPQPPDYRNARWDPDAKQLESLLLATVHMWTLSESKTVVVPLVLRHFVAVDVYQAMCELAQSVGGDKPGGHRDTAERSAGELYAGELYDMIYSLANQTTLPKIVVSSLALPMVPLSTLRTSDDISISARLESLETGLKKLTDSVNKVSNGGARPNQPELTVTTVPVVQQPGGGGGQADPLQGQGQDQQNGDRLQVPAGASFASIVSRNEGAGVSVQSRQRLGSQGGQKRGRDRDGEAPFQPVQNRRRRPVNHGSSQVEVEEAGMAAPVEVYIGNTTPAATEEIVAAVLIKCAKGLDANTEFKVVGVEQLAKQVENPRTKCWKVVIPYKFKDMMEKDEMYPAGWCHRKFFAPRRSGNPAKQPRKEDSLVQEVIQEQQRKEEARRQEDEDKRLDEQMATDSEGQAVAGASPVSEGQAGATAPGVDNTA
jgi:hypothetical protein